MDKETIRDIISALGNSELTFLEKLFVGRIQECFRENWMLTDHQESILEEIYRGKIRRMKKRSGQYEAHSIKRPI